MTIIRSARHHHYTVIENATIEDTSLSFRARGVLVWLLSKPDGWSVDSNVIADAGIEGRDAIRSALTELETVGYLRRERVREGRQWVSVSTIYESPNGQVTAVENVKPLVVPKTAFQASADQASADQAISTKYLTVITEQQKPLAVQAKKPSPRVEEEFDAFWRMYPVKKDRRAALGTWKRMTCAERAEAIEALPAHVAFWALRGGKEFIPSPPHPTTWLNRERWADEMAPIVNVSPEPIQEFFGRKRNVVTGSYFDEDTKAWIQDVAWVRKHPEYNHLRGVG